ncbi:hypothetical protein B0H17DRAFT_1134125 [Mycena rosella]|uniref:Uncharacterized protein n=1 Tax=Mycena rosella TaxID=1033263 RepID=A0AAD7GHA4_MYCRO|nr:hypothetical protein B0H17DRAFT_1134125 [Mycena rosella]
MESFGAEVQGKCASIRCSEPTGIVVMDEIRYGYQVQWFGRKITLRWRKNELGVTAETAAIIGWVYTHVSSTVAHAATAAAVFVEMIFAARLFVAKAAKYCRRQIRRMNGDIDRGFVFLNLRAMQRRQVALHPGSNEHERMSGSAGARARAFRGSARARGSANEQWCSTGRGGGNANVRRHPARALTAQASSWQCLARRGGFVRAAKPASRSRSQTAAVITVSEARSTTMNSSSGGDRGGDARTRRS